MTASIKKASQLRCGRILPGRHERPHLDITDLLIRWMQEPLSCTTACENPVFLEIKKHISPEYHAEVLAMIEELGLEVVYYGII